MLQKIQLALLVVGGLCLHPSLSAQKTTPQNKLSPWTIGLDLASPLNLDGDRDVQSFYDGVTYGRVGANSSYRVARWLALEGQLQFHRRAMSTQQSIFQNNVTGERYTYHLHEQTSLLSLGIGPKFMCRIGQGDLSLAIHYGASINSSTMRAVRFDQQEADISYRPKMLFVQQLELGYTYWPTTQLGISTKVSLQNFRTGRAGRASTAQRLNPKVVNTTLDGLDILELEFLHPQVYRFDVMLLFGVGVHYRFKK